ncbi:hypothetical protein OPT61_g1387 [Boeremia exigua]|uniref:Uncharacterized protein n=1 Tax=Boeremia exigua TaxID=749465 RepID=A0ACC2IQ94_9PLEO|nr:hypothetical protein OPT61_g1387 [Boeremia exigua]
MATISSAAADENRFARYTANNHSAPIWITSLLSLIFSFCILGVRLFYVKLNAHGRDDVALTVAHLLGLGMWGCVFSALHHGLGKSFTLLDAGKISRMQNSLYASRIVLPIALTSSKCSALLFIQSIFCYVKKLPLLSNVSMVVVVLWGLLSSAGISLSCSAERTVPGHRGEYCFNQVTWLKVITAGDVVTEVMTVLLPIAGLFNLQMPRKARLLVVFAFSFRLLNTIMSIMYLVTFSNFTMKRQSATLVAPVVVWQNVLLSYNLMSATIPALKGFVKGFTTGGVGYTGDMSISGGGNGSRNTYELQPLSSAGGVVGLVPEGYPESKARVTTRERHPKVASSRLHKSTGDKIIGNDDESASIASYNSQQIMIRRHWEISRR